MKKEIPNARGSYGSYSEIIGDSSLGISLLLVVSTKAGATLGCSQVFKKKNNQWTKNSVDTLNWNIN